MKYMEILDKWAIYTEYDANQTKFNMLSLNYHWHKVGEVIETILKDYDPTGMIACLYAKKNFIRVMQETQIKLWDFLSNSSEYDDEKEIYTMFMDEALLRAEEEFYGKMNELYARITMGKMIGATPDNMEQIMVALENVVESFSKCKIELVKKGGKIENIKNIDINLHVFNTYAECVLAVEQAIDGMYLCFIRANNSPHCFFAIIIKENGTIVSCNDRIDEAYIGNLTHARNGRWTEAKVDKVFPYDYIFSYSDFDYKGYATEYMLNEEKFNIYELGLEGFMPIMVAMMLLTFRVKETDLDSFPLRYIDSLLPYNEEIITKNELMVIGTSEIVEAHKQVNLSFDTQKLLKGEYAREFTESGMYYERGTFNNKNIGMVELWGQGFEIDWNALHKTNNVKYLTDKEKDANGYIAEFVGSEQRIRMQMYKEIREQLAEYMRDNIYNEWVAFGKTEAVRDWYRKAIIANKDYLFQLMNEHYDGLEAGTSKNGYHNGREMGLSLLIGEKYPNYSYSIKDYYGMYTDSRRRYMDEVNHKECTVWFLITPSNHKDLELLTGQEVPKIVKFWNEDGHDSSGNQNLDATDATDEVGTPFERRESNINKRYCGGSWMSRNESEYQFKIAWGFSKSHFNEIRKEYLKNKEKKGN